MTVRVVTPPAFEPITVAELKDHLRIGSALTMDDVLLAALIRSVRGYAEGYMQRSLVERTLELTLCNFPYVIEIPYPPLRSVTHIKYVDSDGVLQTVDSATYQIDAYREPGLIKPAYQETWPTDVRTSDFNAVQVRYVSGYASGSPSDQASATEAIPEEIKQWLKIRAATLYQETDQIVTGTIVSVIPHPYLDGLLDAYRVLFS